MNQLKENIESVDLLCSLTYKTAVIGVSGKSSFVELKPSPKFIFQKKDEIMEPKEIAQKVVRF